MFDTLNVHHLRDPHKVQNRIIVFMKMKRNNAKAGRAGDTLIGILQS